MTIQELTAMSLMDVEEASVDKLINIKDVHIDTQKTKSERLLDAIEQLKNPYLFLVNNTVIKIEYTPGAPELESVIANVLLGKGHDA